MSVSSLLWGWLVGANVLGKLSGVLLIWIIVGQGPISLAVGVGGGGGYFFSYLSFLFSFSVFWRWPDKTEIPSLRAVKPKSTN